MSDFEVDVAPPVMEWARRTAGLSLADIARAFAPSAETFDAWHARVSAWEAGELRLTYAQACRLAEVVGRPVTALLLPAPPSEVLPLFPELSAEHGVFFLHPDGVARETPWEAPPTGAYGYLVVPMRFDEPWLQRAGEHLLLLRASFSRETRGGVDPQLQLVLGAASAELRATLAELERDLVVLDDAHVPGSPAALLADDYAAKWSARGFTRAAQSFAKRVALPGQPPPLRDAWDEPR